MVRIVTFIFVSFFVSSNIFSDQTVMIGLPPYVSKSYLDYFERSKPSKLYKEMGMRLFKEEKFEESAEAFEKSLELSISKSQKYLSKEYLIKIYQKENNKEKYMEHIDWLIENTNKKSAKLYRVKKRNALYLDEKYGDISLTHRLWE